MIEPEGIDFKKIDSRWTLERKNGENYIEFEKDNNWSGIYKIDEVGKLCYPVEFSTLGWWKFEFKNVNSHGTEHNDAFVFVEGSTWFGVKEGRNVEKSDNRRRIGKKYIKVFRNRNPGTWAWDSYSIDHNAHELYFKVKSTPLKTRVCLAGRSTKFGVGKLLLYNINRGSSGARATPETCASSTSAPDVSKIKRRCAAVTKEKAFQSVSDVRFGDLQVVTSWHDSFALPKHLGDYFGCKFFFSMQLPEGSHKFQIESNDGAVLKTGTRTLVDNDGLHACSKVSNTATPNGQEYVLTYFQLAGGSCLDLWVDGWKIQTSSVSEPAPSPTSPPTSAPSSKIRRKCKAGKFHDVSEVDVSNTEEVFLSSLELPTDLGNLFGCKFFFTEDLGGGSHEFALKSNDGAVLKQGGDVIVDNDGLHSCRVRSATKRVSGDDFVLIYFQHDGSSCLNLKIDGVKLYKEGSESVSPLPEPIPEPEPELEPIPEPEPEPIPEVEDPIISEPSTLREIADARGLYYGAAVNYWRITDKNTNSGDRKQYNNIVKTDYNVLVAENACKFYTIRRQKDDWNWSQCDALIDIAGENGQQFRGHTLSWNKWQPDWIMSTSLSASQKRTILKEHITRVINRYKSRGPGFYTWDVVNEAIADGQTDMTGYKLKKLGPWYPDIPDYLEVAFKAADTARGSSKYPLLFYNDYGIGSAVGITAVKSQQTFNMVKELKNKGVPIDGVGFQLHIQIEYGDVEGVRTNIQRYARLGLEVHLTEVDIRKAGLKWNSNTEERQAEVYAALMQVCLDEPNCTSFLTWGLTDKYTWLGSSKRPLPYDENYEPKMALTALEDTLRGDKKWVNAYYARYP